MTKGRKVSKSTPRKRRQEPPQSTLNNEPRSPWKWPGDDVLSAELAKSPKARPAFEEDYVRATLAHSMAHNSIGDHFHVLEVFSASIEQGLFDQATFDRILEETQIQGLAEIGLDRGAFEEIARSSRTAGIIRQAAIDAHAEETGAKYVDGDYD